MANALATALHVELDQVEQLLATYAPLRDTVEHTPPDIVQITAIAAMLHSFYNGIEHMLVIIAKQVDGQLPTGAQWHRALLAQISHPTSARQAVVNSLMVQRLSPYLAFRHFFRHAYAFVLSWDKIEHLLPPLLPLWADFKHDIGLFLASIDHRSNT